MANTDNDGIVVISGDSKRAENPGDGIVVETLGSDNPGYTTADDGSIIIDPAAIGGTAPSSGDGPTVKRGRGRPRGSGGRRAKADPSIDIGGLENILLSCHAMLAGITKIEELGMEQEEAHKIAEASLLVARHYDLKTSSKTLDWTNFIFVIGEIYGSRIAAIRMRRMFEKRASSTQSAEPQPAPAPQPQPAAAPAQTRNNGATTVVRIPGIGNVEVPLN